MWEAISGVLTGLIGNAVTSIVNYKVQKLKNEHDQAMGKIEIEKLEKERQMMLAEAEANLKITQVQTEGQIELSDAKIFEESIKAAEAKALPDKVLERLLQGKFFSRLFGHIISFLFGIIDFMKGIIRPGLTIYLVALTTWITYTAWQILQERGQNLTTDQAKNIYDNVTTIVIYLTVSCVTWWFGDRRISKFLIRLKDGNDKSKG